MAPPAAAEQPQRIAIEREEDWERVKSNLEHTIKVLVDRRMASEEDPDGKLRKEVEARMMEKIGQIFQSAVPNLRVNGHNYEEYLSMTEPFDEALDSRMFGVQRQVVEYQMNLSDLRRKVPSNIVQLESQIQGMKAQLEWDPPVLPVAGKEVVEEMDVDEPAPRREQVKATFTTTLQNLDSLAKVTSAQLQRADRARAVKEHVAQLTT